MFFIWGSFYFQDIISLPTGISNRIHYKVWDEITYTFPNFNGTAVEVWEWVSNFVCERMGILTPRVYWTLDYISMLGLKLIHIGKKAQDIARSCGVAWDLHIQSCRYILGSVMDTNVTLQNTPQEMN